MLQGRRGDPHSWHEQRPVTKGSDSVVSQTSSIRRGSHIPDSMQATHHAAHTVGHVPYESLTSALAVQREEDEDGNFHDRLSSKENGLAPVSSRAAE
jgi:hypothetical protein